MEKLRNFLKRKDIVFSAKRYFIDAMGAMAQGYSVRSSSAPSSTRSASSSASAF